MAVAPGPRHLGAFANRHTQNLVSKHRGTITPNGEIAVGAPKDQAASASAASLRRTRVFSMAFWVPLRSRFDIAAAMKPG